MQLPYNPAIAVLSIYPREIKTCSHRNLSLNVYSSLIHNCQKLETIQMSLKRWMVKKYMAYPHHGTLFGNKKEGPTATCKDPDEFPDDYAECKRQPQKVIYYMIQFMLPNHKSVCQVPRPCPAVTTEGARHPTKLGLNQRCTRSVTASRSQRRGSGERSPTASSPGPGQWGVLGRALEPYRTQPSACSPGHQLTQWPRSG